MSSMRALGPEHRTAIRAFLRRDPWLRAYELGDLDPDYFPYTRWWAMGDPIEALALLWTAGNPATLICFRRHAGDAVPEQLLHAIASELPRALYAHLSPGLAEHIGAAHEKHGAFLKLGLTEPKRVLAVDTAGTERLSPRDEVEVKALYARSYPGNWFEPRMLATGSYFGARESGALVAVAGVHVVSEEQRVAALGNIVTDPALRGRGLATLVTARLCQELRGRVDHIGLNVKADNAPALRCYQKLGFTRVASYEEVSFGPSRAVD